MKIYWTNKSLHTLSKIHEYIAADNLNAANQLRDKIIVYVETKLVNQPMIGKPGRVNGTRECVIHPSYIIVYRKNIDVIEILAIRHVSQKWPKLF